MENTDRRIAVCAECDSYFYVDIYQKSVESYTDICFGCEKIHTFLDIDFSAFLHEPAEMGPIKIFLQEPGHYWRFQLIKQKRPPEKSSSP